MSNDPAYPLADGDLTGKARIRNAALTLYAAKGPAATTMREVAEAAGVTHGLVVHHFGHKRGLQQAVEQYVVDRLRQVFAEIPTDGTAAELGRARTAAVTRMYAQEPVFVHYLQRALLAPENRDTTLLTMLADFTLEQVDDLREAGIADTTQSSDVQAATVLIRGLGPWLLLPIVTQVWEHLTGDHDQVPEIEVRIKPPPSAPSS